MSYICKLEGKYFLFSDTTDTPVTKPMSLTELREHILQDDRRRSVEELDKRLKRVKAYGTSSFHNSVRETLSFNRFGKGETCLSIEQLKAWVRGELDPEQTKGTVLVDDD